jgi:hypothetical protein
MTMVFPNGVIVKAREKEKDGETAMEMAEETATAGEMEIAGEINNYFS